MGAITLNSVLCGLLYHPVEQHMKRVPITSEKCGVDNKALTLDESITNPQNLSLDQSIHTLKTDQFNPLSSDKSNSNPQNRISQSKIVNETNSSEMDFNETGNERNKTRNETNKTRNETNETRSETRDETKANGLNNLDREYPMVNVPLERYRKISDDLDYDNNKPKIETSQNNKNSFFTATATEKFSLPIVEPTKSSKVPRLFRFCSKKLRKNESSIYLTDETKIDDNTPKKKKFFDLSILKDPIYLVILISNSTSAISNTNFMILLPSYAIAEGFDKNSAALLLSIVSALDLIGRIGGASLSDIDFIPKYYYFVGGLGISGIALALLPMFTSYRMLSFFCGLFGISSGTYIGITTVVLADMLGADRLSSSYGIALFVNGVLQLLGPPILGIIYEEIGTYKPIFLALGIILILGTSLWAIVPIVKRRKIKDVEEN